MRRMVVIGVALGLSAAAPAQAATCAREGTRTLAQSSLIRVYAKGDRAYACWRPTNRARFLTEETIRGGMPQGIRLAGDYLAYEQRFVDQIGDQELTVMLIDVRYRADVQRWELTRPNFEPMAPLRVWGRRLKANGSFAFLAGPESEARQPHAPGLPIYTVYRHDRSGSRVLDRSEFIDRRSFRATRSRISWRRAGRTRSANFR